LREAEGEKEVGTWQQERKMMEGGREGGRVGKRKKGLTVRQLCPEFAGSRGSERRRSMAAREKDDIGRERERERVGK